MRTENSTIRDWLKALGALCAGNLPLEDVRLRVDAMAPLLAREYDRAAFTAASLAHVAKASKFFPSFAEVCTALTEHRKAHAPIRLAIAPPVRFTPAPTEEALVQRDEDWWQERIADCGAMPHPTVRWRHAVGMHATLTRPGAVVRHWAIGRLTVIIEAAEQQGADTDPSKVRWPTGAAPSFRHIAYAEGKRSAILPDPPPPPKPLHLTPEQIAAAGHRERRA